MDSAGGPVLFPEFCCKTFVMNTMVLCWGLGRTGRFARLLSPAAPPGAYGSLGDTKKNNKILCLEYIRN